MNWCVFPGKLNVTKDVLQDAVNALILLQINSIKKGVNKLQPHFPPFCLPYQPILHFFVFSLQINENEFGEATRSVFTPDQIPIIWQFVTSKRDLMKNLLNQFGVHEFRFRDLEWRLEARISSRSLRTQAIPFISIKLYLDTEAINEYKSCLALVTRTRAIIRTVHRHRLNARRNRFSLF